MRTEPTRSGKSAGAWRLGGFGWRGAGWLLGLLAGGAGGFLFTWLALPVPWLLGSLAAVLVAIVSGLPVRLSLRGRAFGQILIGCTLGFALDRAVLAELVTLIVPVLLAAVLSLLLGLLAALVLRRTTSLSWPTAFFACAPAGIAEMAILGGRYGGDPAVITVFHTVRVVSVVMLVPFLVALGTQLNPPPAAGASIAVDWSWLPLTVAAAAGFALLLHRLRVPNAYMLGSIVFGAGLRVFEVPLPPIPDSLFAFGQVILGTSLALQFRRERMAQMAAWAVPASVAALVVLALSILMALAFSMGLGVDALGMIVAIAPGGTAEMAVAALSLGLEVPLVLAFHLSRIFLTNGFIAPLFVLTEWKQGRR